MRHNSGRNRTDVAACRRGRILDLGRSQCDWQVTTCYSLHIGTKQTSLVGCRSRLCREIRRSFWQEFGSAERVKMTRFKPYQHKEEAKKSARLIFCDWCARGSLSWRKSSSSLLVCSLTGSRNEQMLMRCVGKILFKRVCTASVFPSGFKESERTSSAARSRNRPKRPAIVLHYLHSAVSIGRATGRNIHR